MDLNTARQLPIVGYEHPESTNLNRNKQYKTFTEGEKTFGTTFSGKHYASYNTEENDISDSCPVCSVSSFVTCPCAYNDKKCENNHIWYTTRDGKIQVGNPHKK
jgi:hypothetical protein